MQEIVIASFKDWGRIADTVYLTCIQTLILYSKFKCNLDFIVLLYNLLKKKLKHLNCYHECVYVTWNLLFAVVYNFHERLLLQYYLIETDYHPDGFILKK